MATHIVDTPSGKLEGEDRGTSLVFRGVPFAAPPVGARRFRAPEPLPAWQGIRKATSFGRAAPQNDALVSLVRNLVGAAAGYDEDCLYLNVWTPAADNRRRPVMVFLHGGAFVLGSGATAMYSGEYFATRRDVVLVTINYRLGALGFLNTRGLFADDGEIVANAGLLDQIAALRWVRNHIECFGGNPEQVTIFGESAGAMSVGTLLGTPAAQDLFHRAILQSGAAENVSSATRAREVAELFLTELGSAGESPHALRSTPVERLLAVQRTVAGRLGVMLGILPWQPSIDGTLLPEPPLRAIATGRVPPVPVIIGTNRDEWRLFLLADPRRRTLDEDGLRRRIARTLEAITGDPGDLVEDALSCYGAAYGPPIERWCAFQSDRVFHAPAAILADVCTAAGRPPFVYRFDWSPPLFGGLTGAFHGLELPFVFGTLRSGLFRATLGVRRDARRLSSQIQRAWAAFARDGTPGEALPDWRPYEPDERLAMILGPDTGPHRHVHEVAARFFAPVLAAGVERGPAERHAASAAEDGAGRARCE